MMSKESKMKLYEKEVLKTLSYFEKMNLEKIYLDFDQSFSLENPEFCIADLKSVLKRLEKSKKVKRFKASDKSHEYLRVYPKRKLLTQLKAFLKGVGWKI